MTLALATLALTWGSAFIIGVAGLVTTAIVMLRPGT